MMVSVSVEMCFSVTDVPPISDGVVEVKSPAVSSCLRKEVSPITNSRNAFGDPMRSSAERLSSATRFGLNSSIADWICTSQSSRPATSG